MSIEGLIGSMLLVAVTLAAVLVPLFGRGGQVATSNAATEQLTQSYDRILTNIRDLDEDFSAGKLDETTYKRERDAWLQRGVQTLETLERQGERHANRNRR